MLKKRINKVVAIITCIIINLAIFFVIPKNDNKVFASGVDNIVARANYLYNSTWVAQKNVAGWDYTFVKGNTYRIPYGQPVTSGKYICFGVSVDDYLAAAANASSIFYTSQSYYSGSKTKSTYYATDCSGFVSYCWGISRTTTSYWANLNVTNFGKVNSSNVSKIQKGDALNLAGSHVVLVTAVNSNGTYEITEQTPPQLKRSTYTASQLISKYSSYTIYRYNKRDSVPAAPNSHSVTIHYNANGGSIASDSNYYAASNGDIYKTSDKKIIASTWENGYKDPNGLYNASTFKLSRTGYQFLGWSLQKSGGKIYDQDDNTVSANDLFPDIKTKNGTVTLYAQWKKNSVTIHYNTNGGSIASDSNYYAASNGDIYRKSDNKLMGPTWENGYKDPNGLVNASTIKLTRSGYTFLGWSLQKSGGKIYDQDDSSVSANDLFPDIKTKNGTVTLYAQWAKNTVAIHYNANGGSIASDSNYYAASNGDIYRKSDNKLAGPTWEYGYKDENGLVNISTWKLSRTGYKFLGWSLSKSGGKIYDQDDNTVSANDLFPDVKNKNGTVMLYAQWDKNTVTIHYNTNGGSITSDSNYYAASNGDIYRKSDNKLMGPTWENGYKDSNGLTNASTVKLSKSGYQFLGWSLQKSGGKIYDQDDNTVSANDLFPQVTSKSGTVMLYAQWAKNTVTINYNANGGNVASDSDFYIGSNDDIYSKSNNKLMANKWENGYKGSNGLYNASTIKLTKPGYTFLGWSLQKSGGKIYDQDDNTISANDLFPDVKNKNGTVMLYAQWAKNFVTINYNANGGNVASDSDFYIGSNDDIYSKSNNKLMANKWENGYKGSNGLYNASTIKLTKPGYTFLGWSLQKSGGKIYDQDDNTISANDLFPQVTSKNGTVMLYAQWEKLPDITDSLKGDIDDNGKVNVSDLVMLQKWLINSGNLTDWKNADLYEDNIINVFDMVLLKRLIIKNQ